MEEHRPFIEKASIVPGRIVRTSSARGVSAQAEKRLQRVTNITNYHFFISSPDIVPMAKEKYRASAMA
jgi:hypothetical protein